MRKVTTRELEAAVRRLNKRKGLPVEPITTGKGWNIGSYFISQAYGGYKLVQVNSDAGGTKDITTGYRPKRELLDIIELM